jgi:hypothetical protein
MGADHDRALRLQGAARVLVTGLVARATRPRLPLRHDNPEARLSLRSCPCPSMPILGIIASHA